MEKKLICVNTEELMSTELSADKYTLISITDNYSRALKYADPLFDPYNVYKNIGIAENIMEFNPYRKRDIMINNNQYNKPRTITIDNYYIYSYTYDYDNNIDHIDIVATAGNFTAFERGNDGDFKAYDLNTLSWQRVIYNFDKGNKEILIVRNGERHFFKINKNHRVKYYIGPEYAFKYEYDGKGRLTKKILVNKKNEDAIFNYHYGYDSNDNMSTITIESIQNPSNNVYFKYTYEN